MCRGSPHTRSLCQNSLRHVDGSPPYTGSGCCLRDETHVPGKAVLMVFHFPFRTLVPICTDPSSTSSSVRGWCCQFPCVHPKSGISPVLNSANDQTRCTITCRKTDQCLSRARTRLTLSSTGGRALLLACRFPACRFPMGRWRSGGGGRSYSWTPEISAWPGPDHQCLKIP